MIKKFEEFVKLNESNFNNDWIKMLSEFLQLKSHKEGDIKFGKKEHIWRNAVVPTKDKTNKTNTQTLNCFLDFTGSSDMHATFNFLCVLVDLCVKNKYSYSKINVYGFGERLSKPFVIDLQDEDVKSRYLDLIISRAFDFIESQKVGANTERFEEVVEEINILKQKNKDSVFLIFGDGIWWQDLDSFEDCSALRDICVIVCYSDFTEKVSKTRLELEFCGFKHIIYAKYKRLIDEL